MCFAEMNPLHNTVVLFHTRYRIVWRTYFYKTRFTCRGSLVKQGSDCSRQVGRLLFCSEREVASPCQHRIHNYHISLVA